jgi:hypothetical protein
MAGFPASWSKVHVKSEWNFVENFQSEWNFAGFLFGKLLVRITEYLLNGSLREVKFQTKSLALEAAWHQRWHQCGGKHGGSVAEAATVATAAQQKHGGGSSAVVAAAWQRQRRPPPLPQRCCRMPPQW